MEKKRHSPTDQSIGFAERSNCFKDEGLHQEHVQHGSKYRSSILDGGIQQARQKTMLHFEKLEALELEALALLEQRKLLSSPLGGGHHEVCYSPTSSHRTKDSPPPPPPTNKGRVKTMRSNSMPAVVVSRDVVTAEQQRQQRMLIPSAVRTTESLPKTRQRRISAQSSEGDRYWFVRRSALTNEVPHSGIMEVVFFDTIEVPTSTLNVDET